MEIQNPKRALKNLEARKNEGKWGLYLRGSLAHLLRNLVDNSSQRTVLLGRQGRQRRISFRENIILSMKFPKNVLLQIRVKFDLIHHGLMFCNLEDMLEIFDSKIGHPDVFRKA
jgi:hypothetical protein